MPNKALQQNRDNVLRYGESIGCDLLKAAVRQQEAPSQSQSSGGASPTGDCSVVRFVRVNAEHPAVAGRRNGIQSV
jgi:hypothetical protein